MSSTTPPPLRISTDREYRESIGTVAEHPVLGVGKFLERTRRLAAIHPDEQALVMGDNARRVYRLDDTAQDIERLGMPQ